MHAAGEEPGKKRRLVRGRKVARWNCGDRPDTEPKAERHG